MARTRTCKGSVLAVAVALVAAGCDPYPSKNRAKPEVLAVFASDGATVVDGQLSGGTWTLALPSFSPAPSTVAAQQPVIIVKTNKLLDGSTIQTTDQTANSDGDCTPKDGWLGVSPAPAAGNVWYSCYDPSSPTTLAGSSIVLFQGAIANPISRSGDGWFTVAVLPGLDNAPQTYTLSGSVKDQDGNDLPISINVTVNPP